MHDIVCRIVAKAMFVAGSGRLYQSMLLIVDQNAARDADRFDHLIHPKKLFVVFFYHKRSLSRSGSTDFEKNLCFFCNNT